MFISCVASSVVTAASKFCLKIGLGRERKIFPVPGCSFSFQHRIRACQLTSDAATGNFFFLLSLTYLMPPTHRQMTGPPHQTSLVTQRPFMWAQVATGLPLKLFFNE